MKTAAGRLIIVSVFVGLSGFWMGSIKAEDVQVVCQENQCRPDQVQGKLSWSNIAPGQNRSFEVKIVNKDKFKQSASLRLSLDKAKEAGGLKFKVKESDRDIFEGYLTKPVVLNLGELKEGQEKLIYLIITSDDQLDNSWQGAKVNLTSNLYMESQELNEQEPSESTAAGEGGNNQKPPARKVKTNKILSNLGLSQVLGKQSQEAISATRAAKIAKSRWRWWLAIGGAMMLAGGWWLKRRLDKDV
ncbi:MAG: hypothetical protein GXP43_03475 [bacterium]|nr:hypothetical protein [bacterium]